MLKICINFEKLCFHTTLNLCACLQFSVALQVLYEVVLKILRKTKDPAPGTCVLQSSVQEKISMGKECFRAKKLWDRVATRYLMFLGSYLL